MKAVAFADAFENSEITSRSVHQRHENVLDRVLRHATNAVAEDLEGPLNQVLRRFVLTFTVSYRQMNEVLETITVRL